MLEFTSHSLPTRLDGQAFIPTPQEIGSQWVASRRCAPTLKGRVESGDLTTELNMSRYDFADRSRTETTGRGVRQKQTSTDLGVFGGRNRTQTCGFSRVKAHSSTPMPAEHVPTVPLPFRCRQLGAVAGSRGKPRTRFAAGTHRSSHLPPVSQTIVEMSS